MRIRFLLVAFCSILLSFTSKAVTVTNPPPSHIVMLKADASVDALVSQFSLQPKFVYRHALNGFAAAIDSATLAKLKADARVVSVGENGDIHLGCSYRDTVIVPASEIITQQIPAGIVRIGLTNFPMTR